MGNAESGPELMLPQEGSRTAGVLETTLVYSGGKAVAVPVHYSRQAIRQEEDVRQPMLTPHSRDDPTRRVAFHAVNGEPTLSPTINHSPTTDKNMEMTPKMEFQNSILESVSEDENEVSKLLKRIASLGTELIEATAAVYHFLETNSMDDEMTVNGRSNAVLRQIKQAAEKGNTQPAYKFLETAKAVSEVLQDEEQEQQSEIDNNQSTPLVSRSLNDKDDHSTSTRHLLGETGSLIGGGSIFRMLDEEEVVKLNSQSGQCKSLTKVPPTSNSVTNAVHIACDIDCIPIDILSPFLPMAQTSQKAMDGEILASISDQKMDKYTTEAKSTAEETDIQSFNSGDWSHTKKNLERNEDYPEIRPILSDSELRFDLTDLPQLHAVDDDMDLEFVEHFDMAFNEFIASYPEFLTRNPDLVHNLRIFKLQRLLEYNQNLESELKRNIERLVLAKKEMEDEMHGKLRDAARKKAARQTFLQSELSNLSWSTKRVQAQLRWKFLRYSADRAKRQFKMRQQFKAIPQAHSQQDLIALVPESPEGNQLKAAIQAAKEAGGSTSNSQSARQLNQLREYQAENSMLGAKLSMLQKKLAALHMETRKYAWVESVLVRVDESTMDKLKIKFQKKEGVSKL